SNGRATPGSALFPASAVRSRAVRVANEVARTGRWPRSGSQRGAAEAMHPRRPNWQALTAAAVFLLALALGRPLVSSGYLFPDSYAYIEWPADFVLAGATRVMGARPIGYALFLDVFGTGATLVWAQTVLSFAAWAALGWSAGRLPGVVVGCAI